MGGKEKGGAAKCVTSDRSNELVWVSVTLLPGVNLRHWPAISTL